MKLHANAPLGPKGRAIMVRRVLEEGEMRVPLSVRKTAGWSERPKAGRISERYCSATSAAQSNTVSTVRRCGPPPRLALPT
jgi:hypothetical protein